MSSVVLLEDYFGGMEPGVFSADVGAHTEYHFLLEAAPKQGWTVAAFTPGREAGQAWQVQEENGARAMVQTFHNPATHTHPMLAAGHALWADYTVKLRFTPKTKHGQSGLAFRYHNSRCYYFFGFDAGGVVLKSVQHETAFHQPAETILDRKACNWQPGQVYTMEVKVRGENIHARIEGVASLRAVDARYLRGQVALLADGLTVFHHIRVTTTTQEKHYFQRLKSRQERELDELREQYPKPVVWKKLRTKGFGAGRNLRFGDLNGDGKMDILIGQVKHHGPGDQYSELSCLTAMTLDGKILWQTGKPNPKNYHLTSDVGFQIHDIDGDGASEVIYCMNCEIIVADGATGQVKYKSPTPLSKPPANRYPRILGDCLFFCDLRGTGQPRDVIIKDRYWHFWALDDRLQPLWEGSCRTGHYPYAADIDGDGHDELAVGFSLYDHDGRLMWTLEDRIEDHADGVAIVNFMEHDRAVPKVFYTASDSGVVYADLKGNILRQHFIGHAQNPAIARFRPDLPGLQAVTINFWGNQGILHFFDANGTIYQDAAPNPFGSMCLPVNWTGQPAELFVHSPDVRWGGMFDGWGRSVVMFPDDGHPAMCNAVLNLTGDCRDEVVVWNQNELWVYTQDDNPKSGRLYQPVRNPLYNYSNYQATVSLPGWSE